MSTQLFYTTEHNGTVKPGERLRRNNGSRKFRKFLKLCMRSI